MSLDISFSFQVKNQLYYLTTQKDSQSKHDPNFISLVFSQTKVKTYSSFLSTS